MQQQHYGKFKDVVAYLRKHLPPAHKVTVRRIHALPKDRLGDIALKKKGGTKTFVIRVTRKLENDLAVLVMLHEWAHAICWQEGTKISLNHHGPEWGIAYSRVYLKFEEYLSS